MRLHTWRTVLSFQQSLSFNRTAGGRKISGFALGGHKNKKQTQLEPKKKQDPPLATGGGNLHWLPSREPRSALVLLATAVLPAQWIYSSSLSARRTKSSWKAVCLSRRLRAVRFMKRTSGRERSTRNEGKGREGGGREETRGAYQIESKKEAREGANREEQGNIRNC